MLTEEASSLVSQNHPLNISNTLLSASTNAGSCRKRKQKPVSPREKSNFKTARHCEDMCVSCRTEVTGEEQAFQCDCCNRWQHRSCGTSNYLHKTLVICDQIVALHNCGASCVILERIVHFLMQLNLLYNLLIHVFTVRFVCSICSLPPKELNDATSKSNVQMGCESESECTSAGNAEDKQNDNTATLFIDIPVEVNESALEPTILISETHEEGVIEDLRIIPGGSIRGKDLLVDSQGYRYTVKRTQKSSVIWTCAMRAKGSVCSATVKQVGNTFIRGPTPHMPHRVVPGAEVVAKVKKEIRELAAKDVFASSKGLVEKALQELQDPCPAMPPVQNLVRTTNKLREKIRGPQSVVHNLLVSLCKSQIRLDSTMQSSSKAVASQAATEEGNIS